MSLLSQSMNIIEKEEISWDSSVLVVCDHEGSSTKSNWQRGMFCPSSTRSLYGVCSEPLGLWIHGTL